MTSSSVPTGPISTTISLSTDSKQMSDDELKSPPHFTFNIWGKIVNYVSGILGNGTNLWPVF